MASIPEGYISIEEAYDRFFEVFSRQQARQNKIDSRSGNDQENVPVDAAAEFRKVLGLFLNDDDEKRLSHFLARVTSSTPVVPDNNHELSGVGINVLESVFIQRLETYFLNPDDAKRLIESVYGSTLTLDVTMQMLVGDSPDKVYADKFRASACSLLLPNEAKGGKLIVHAISIESDQRMTLADDDWQSLKINPDTGNAERQHKPIYTELCLDREQVQALVPHLRKTFAQVGLLSNFHRGWSAEAKEWLRDTAEMEVSQLEPVEPTDNFPLSDQRTNNPVAPLTGDTEAANNAPAVTIEGGNSDTENKSGTEAIGSAPPVAGEPSGSDAITGRRPLKGQTEKFLEQLFAQWPEQYRTLFEEPELSGLVKIYTGMTRKLFRKKIKAMKRNYKVPENWCKRGPTTLETIPENELHQLAEGIVLRLSEQK